MIFVRGPSSRATASVPERDGGASPAVPFADWVGKEPARGFCPVSFEARQTIGGAK